MPGIFIEEDGALIYVTEQCNSNCIMCPMSTDSRRRGSRLTPKQWKEIPAIIPGDIRHITITGGEPFLEHENFLPALNCLTNDYPDTDILILTNGRALSIQSIFLKTAEAISDRVCFAIPVHAPNESLHDMITQSPGSFRQTMKAIKLLKSTLAQIEVRIVCHQLNISSISETMKMLTDSDLRITTINLVAMEMMGCAAANRELLWINYDEIGHMVLKGIQYAVKGGINVGLYNFPLCMVPRKLWPIVKNSITPSKVRFYTECERCKERDACGGLFYSTYELGLCKVIPF